MEVPSTFNFQFPPHLCAGCVPSKQCNFRNLFLAVFVFELKNKTGGHTSGLLSGNKLLIDCLIKISIL